MSQSKGRLFQVAMVDRRSVESPFLRERQSRKSGHTCTVCGAVFGIWASLAEHKEVHYNDRKSLSSQQPKPEKRRTLKSKKLLKKEQVSSDKKTAPDGIGRHQMIDHLNCGPVTDATLTGLPDLKFVEQNLTRVSVDHCSNNSLNNCRSIRQETELKSNVLNGTINSLTDISLKNADSCRPRLRGDCSETFMPSKNGQLGWKRKFNSEGKDVAESLSSEHDSIYTDRRETQSTTKMQFPNPSEKSTEIVDIKYSMLNKNQRSPNEYDSKSIGCGKIGKSLSMAEVAGVNQAEVSRFFDMSLRKKVKNKGQGLPEKTDCLSDMQKSPLPVKDNFVLQTVISVETEVESKVCSEMSFTVNSTDLLDVEEEVVCTEDIVQPTLCENSSQRHKTTRPVQDVPLLIISSSASKVPTSMNSCVGSHLVILQNPEESHTEKPGIQMVSLLKTNPRNTEESCKEASAVSSPLLMKSKTSEAEETSTILPPSSQIVLMKKFRQSGHLSPKQIISLLKPHQNHVTVTDRHWEVNLTELSTNQKCGTPQSHRSPVGMVMVFTDEKVVQVAGLNSKSVTAKKKLTIESCDDASEVALVENCTGSPITSIDFVENETSQVSSEEVQCSLRPSDILAECDDKPLDQTYGIIMQHQQINGVKKEIVDLGTAVDSDHAVQISMKFLEVVKSDLTLESAAITPEQLMKTLKLEKTVHYFDFMDSFACRLCSEKFSNQVELDMHHKSQHLCLKCDRVFRQTSNLRKHQRVSHESYRPHRCETCGKCFPFLSSLKEHLLIHSRSALEKVHTCEVCGKAFTRASGLRKHSKEEHLVVKPYVCVQCHKGFAYMCSLKSHMRAHSSERPFSCNACDQRFKQSSNLRKHVRLHHRPKCNLCQGCCTCVQQTEEVAGYGKSTICEVCGRACEGQKQLTIHMRVHTGEKPEVCDVCGKSFQHKSNLLKHQLKHSGTKAFACKFCGRAFYANHSLLSHMRLHTGESPFQCDACGKRFCTKNGLQVHSLLHSNTRPFACGTCGKMFTQLGNLNKHVALHTGERPFVCAYCDKGFVDSSALKRHALKHTVEYMLECSTCGKLFQHLPALQSHELLHASEENCEYVGQQCEPLVCVVCSKSFLHRTNYLKHMQRHRKMPSEVDEIVLNPGEFIVCLTE